MGFMTNPLIGQSSDGMDSLLIVCSGEVFFREIFESCQSNGSVYWGAFIGFLLGGKGKLFKRGEIKKSAYEYLMKSQRRGGYEEE